MSHQSQAPQQQQHQPPAGYYQQPPPVRPTSGAAVTGFILTILWGFGIFSLIGLILCFSALSDTKSGRRGGHGLAIAGIVIGIIGVLGLVLVGIPLLGGILNAASA